HVLMLVVHQHDHLAAVRIEQHADLASIHAQMVATHFQAAHRRRVALAATAVVGAKIRPGSGADAGESESKGETTRHEGYSSVGWEGVVSTDRPELSRDRPALSPRTGCRACGKLRASGPSLSDPDRLVLFQRFLRVLPSRMARAARAVLARRGRTGGISRAVRFVPRQPGARAFRRP